MVRAGARGNVASGWFVTLKMFHFPQKMRIKENCCLRCKPRASSSSGGGVDKGLDRAAEDLHQPVLKPPAARSDSKQTINPPLRYLYVFILWNCHTLTKLKILFLGVFLDPPQLSNTCACCPRWAEENPLDMSVVGFCSIRGKRPKVAEAWARPAGGPARTGKRTHR